MDTGAKILLATNAEFIAEWCGGRVVIQHDPLDHDSTSVGVNIPVGDEIQRAQVGDIVVRHSDGSFRIDRKNT